MGKYLALQLRHKQNKQTIQKLVRHNSGKTIYNPQIIADTFAEYYESLYNIQNDNSVHQPQPLDIAQFLEKVNPTIDHSTLEKLKEPISLNEINNVFQFLPTNKVPGAAYLAAFLVNTLKHLVKYYHLT